MKQSEIEVGACYTNGKGAIRRVTKIHKANGFRPAFLEYEVLAGRFKSGIYIDQRPDVTSFARWAKSRVESAPTREEAPR